MANTQHAFWICSAENEPVLLRLEPWANETRLSSGKQYQIVFEGPTGQWPGIKWRKDGITAYGWSGSVATVYLDGELILDCSTRVPAMPEPQ
jgi:hypothetical protein